MKVLISIALLGTLSVVAPTAGAFIASRRTGAARGSCSPRPLGVSLSPPSTTTPVDGAFDDGCPYKDTYDLNKALRRLASLKGERPAAIDDDDDDAHDEHDDDAAADDELSSDNLQETPRQSSSSSSSSSKRSSSSLIPQYPKDTSSASVIARAAACQEEWDKYRHHERVQADLFSFNTVLKAWARCCQFLAEHRNDKVTLSLDTAAATTTISGTGTTIMTPTMSIDLDLSIYSVYTAQEAAQRAVDLLYQQEAEAAAAMAKKTDDNSTVIPSTASYNICMDAWSKCRRPESSNQVEQLFERLLSSKTLQPTLLSYNALIDSYAHSDEPHRMERVLELWNDIQESPDIRPSVWTYNAILYAYSRAGKVTYDKQKLQQSQERIPDTMSPYAAAKECLVLLQQMKQAYDETNAIADRPDMMTYSIVIEALSRCGSVDMTNKAEELLQEVKRTPYLNPTAYTYSGVMAAWARTRHPEAPQRADILLQEVLDKRMANTKAFTTTMQTWSRSNSPKKAARCLELLKQMKEMKATGVTNVSPDPFAYQTVIDACASVTGDAVQQNAALRIAFAVFKSMQLDQNVQINTAVFCSLLNAAGRLLPPGDERTRVASAVFEKAVAAKQVDGRVVRSLQQVADASTAQQLIASTEIQDGGADKSGRTSRQRGLR